MLTRRRLLQLTSLAGAGAATGGGHSLASANTVETTRTAIAVPGTEGAAGFRIALIADVHAPQPGLDFDAVVRAANEAEPDLVVVVGDAINRREDIGLLSMYGPLKARCGKFATVGNWENWALVPSSALREHYRRAGFELLHNQAVPIPELGVRVVGLDERTNGRPDWSLVSSAADEPRTILLHHSPGAFDFLAGRSPSPTLLLAGHTHGGQVAPLGRALVLPPGSRGYVSGAYSAGRHRMYVTRGIGNSHVPLRIGSRPELALIDVTASDAV